MIRGIVIYDVYVTGDTPDLSLSGDDTIDGNDGHDIVYAGDGVDTVHGNGDDQVFGNINGDDILFGDADQDDLIGGTGRTDSSSPTSAVDGRLDGRTRSTATTASTPSRATTRGWSGAPTTATRATTPARGRRTRSTPPSTGRSRSWTWASSGQRPAPVRAGNDRLLGDDQDDVAYGQGGNDGISGGAHQDVLEGNANGTGDALNPDPGIYATWPTFEGDVIHGDSGADDIAGGTGWIFRMVSGVETCDTMSLAAGSQPCNPLAGIKVGTDGRLDGADTVFGDGGGDSLAGDNTVIERL